MQQARDLLVPSDMTKPHYGTLFPQEKLDCLSLTDVAKDFVAGHESRLFYLADMINLIFFSL